MLSDQDRRRLDSLSKVSTAFTVFAEQYYALLHDELYTLKARHASHEHKDSTLTDNQQTQVHVQEIQHLRHLLGWLYTATTNGDVWDAVDTTLLTQIRTALGLNAS